MAGTRSCILSLKGTAYLFTGEQDNQTEPDIKRNATGIAVRFFIAKESGASIYKHCDMESNKQANGKVKRRMRWITCL